MNKVNYSALIALMTLTLAEMALRVLGIGDTYLESIGKPYKTYWNQKHQSWYWVQTPNISYPDSNMDFHYVINTNSLGHREEEPRHQSAIILGDSFTEGTGAPYDSSYVRQLEEIVSRQYSSINFYDAGVGGADPWFNYADLRDRLLHYHPDFVIQAINASDYYDYSFRGAFERFLPDSTTAFRRAPWYEPCYHYSYLFRALSRQFTNAAFMPQCEEANQQLVILADSFRLLAEANEFKLLFVLHPLGKELSGNGNNFIKQLPELQAALQARGFAVVNISNQMDSVINADNYLHYHHQHDWHFNAAGYRLLAESIAKELDRHYPQFWE